jgi:L-threonylcarbamoyladenylate synthase
MQTEIISIEEEGVFQRACDELTAGHPIAFPTDTVYGLGTRLDDVEAIEALYQIKRRDSAKAIPVLIGDFAQMNLVSPGWSPEAEALALHFWPGALTLVVSRHSYLPAALSALPTIGVRMPNHPFALRLLNAIGPMAVTSASLSGGSNTTTAEEVFEQLDGLIPLICDGGTCPGGVPSTVVDCSSPELHILREGAVPSTSILEYLNRSTK